MKISIPTDEKSLDSNVCVSFGFIIDIPTNGANIFRHDPTSFFWIIF